MNTKLEITIEPEDPEMTRRMKLFERNGQWFSDHALEIGDEYRGQYIAVAGGEIFASPDRMEARRLALEKYPDDVPYVQYIFKEKMIRIYGLLLEKKKLLMPGARTALSATSRQASNRLA
jgi:hypothetical protein